VNGETVDALKNCKKKTINQTFVEVKWSRTITNPKGTGSNQPNRTSEQKP
jgi:hypothetical protein